MTESRNLKKNRDVLTLLDMTNSNILNCMLEYRLFAINLNFINDTG